VLAELFPPFDYFMPLTIRQAETSEDREQVYRFRYEIYVKEMGKPMPGADHARWMLRDEGDEQATHLMALDGGELVGALRIIWGSTEIPESYRAWYGLGDFANFPATAFSFTGRLMVLPGLRNSLTASALAGEAFRIGCERGVKFDFIHTTPPLVRFFERLGHRRYRADFVDPDLGPRIPMVLALEEREHLDKCRSPLLRRAGTMVHEGGTSDWLATHFAHFSPEEVFA
jgi:predicted GNAT family N-acyltransferase